MDRVRCYINRIKDRQILQHVKRIKLKTKFGSITIAPLGFVFFIIDNRDLLKKKEEYTSSIQKNKKNKKIRSKKNLTQSKPKLVM